MLNLSKPSHVARRAVNDTCLAAAVAVGFGLVWLAQNISDTARSLMSFAAAVLFVVFFNEAARSWRRVREERERGSART